MALYSSSRKLIKFLLTFLCILGFILSMYAFHVEITKKRDPSYSVWCDFSQSVSCSKVFTSRYGTGFGLVDRVLSKDSIFNQPNSVFGMAFYTMQIFMTFSNSDNAIAVQSFLSLLANFGSIYLFYILYFVLHDFCVVCISIYIVNALILVCAMQRLLGMHKKIVKKLS